MQLTPVIKARNEKKKKKTPLFQCDKRKNHAVMLSHHIQSNGSKKRKKEIC